MRNLRLSMHLEGNPKDINYVVQRALKQPRLRKSASLFKPELPSISAKPPTRYMKLTQSVYQTACEELSRLRDEQGAILIGPVDDEELVDELVVDRWGKGSPAHFEFHAEKLNQILRQCITRGRDCRGFIHSHPSGVNLLSNGDIDYVKKVFALNKDVESFYMPIFVDGIIRPFIVKGHQPDHPEKVHLLLI